jgi:putative selenium metabolism protein SsnA
MTGVQEPMRTQLNQIERKPLVIGNGVVTDGLGLFVEQGGVLIDGDEIGQLGPVHELDADQGTFVDVGGRLIVPGLLNAHHHLYSSFAPGISPLGDTDTFAQILDNLWWSLDLALDEEAVYYSALIGVIESVKHGVTMIFDHHASMGYVRGSLGLVADAFRLAGIKGLLCFETSDRMGNKNVDSHIEENLDFAAASAGADVRGVFGLHANLSLSEETLTKIGRVKPAAMPIHIHCGEDLADLEYCRELGYQGPVERLQHFGLLTPDSILAHAIHLSKRDYEILNELRPVIVSNPESNANNRVGSMDRKLIGRYLLGTDGMSPDMVGTLRSHYLLGGTVPFDEMQRTFFEHRYEVQQHFFPKTGRLRAGMSADLAVLDYVPVSPICSENILGHLIFGVRAGKAYMTVAGGRVLYHAGELTFVDENEVTQKATEVAMGLHGRFLRGGSFGNR